MSEKPSEEVFSGNVEPDKSWILLKSSASNMDIKSVKDEQPPPEQGNVESEGSSVEVLPNKSEDKIKKDNETENAQSAQTGTSDHPDGDLSDDISIISETEGVETRPQTIEYLILGRSVGQVQEEEEEIAEEEEEEPDAGVAAKDGNGQTGFVVNKSLIPSLRPRRKLTPTSSKKRPKKVREVIESRRDGVSRLLMLSCAIIAVAIVLPFFTARNGQEEASKLEALLDRFESIENHINLLSEGMSKMQHEFEHMRLNMKPPDERQEIQSEANENIEPTETFTINDLFSGLSDIIDTVRENIVTSYDEGNLNVVEPTVAVKDPKIEIPTPVIDESHKENPYQQPPPRYDNQHKKEYNKNYKNENNKYPQKPTDHKEFDHQKQKRNEEWRHDNGYKKDYNKNYNENQKYDKNYKDQSKRNDRKYHQNDKYSSEKYKGEPNYDERKSPDNYKGDKEHDNDWYQNMMNHRQEHREKNNENFKNEYNWYIKRGGERERVRDQDEKYRH